MGEEKRRVAAYCRVSTDREDQANSFAAQVRYFEDYIRHKPEWVLADIYADEGITGTSTKKRAQFRRMLDDAAEGKFQLLLTKEVSRFSRNILDTITYTRQLRALGIPVIFLSDGFSTAEPDAELRLSIMGSIAQEESRKTSQRVTWGQTRQMERGVVFGHSLLGYTVKNGTLTVSQPEAELVRLIFHKYAVEQMGTTELCRWLEQRGYRTGSGGTKWHSGYLIKLLKNEKYAGDLVQKKSYTPNYLTHEKKTNHGEKIVLSNHHTPIVERHLWELAQTRLASRRRHSESPVSGGGKSAFSGLIRCGVCGRNFVSRSKRGGDGNVYRRWACGGNTCRVGHLLRDDDAQHMVRLALQTIAEGETVIDDLLQLLQQAIRTGDATEKDDAATIKQRINTLKECKSKLLDSFCKSIISEEEFSDMQQRYNQELKSCQQRLAALPTACDTVRISEPRADLAALMAGEVWSDALCRAIVEQITVFGDKHYTLRFRGLDRVWQFS